MFRNEYNGCKTFGCENLGNPDLNLYTPSSRLGYPAYYCPKCGAYPPKLLNRPIITLANYIDQQRRNAITSLSLQCRCQGQLPGDNPVQRQWRPHDKTRIGTQRLRCSQCHTVASLANPKKQARSLQPLLDLLLSGCPANELQIRSALNKKLFYQRLRTLTQLLEAVSYSYEQCWLAQQHTVSLHTHSHVVRCRSGLSASNNTKVKSAKLKQRGLDCWFLTTADSATGYLLLISDNLLPQSSMDIRKAHQCHHPDESGEYTLDSIEQAVPPSKDVLHTAKLTYQKIMSRQQFDKLAYCTREFAKSNEGTLLRPVYAAHSHFQNLKQHLPSNIDLNLVLEHESFIRGAAITAFAEQVKLDQANLYYLHAFPCHEPSFASSEVTSNKQTLSWWHEKWYQFSHHNQCEHWQLGLGVLTHTGQLEISTKNNAVPTRPDWHNQFWCHFDNWLPASYRSKISHAQLMQWIGIFRYLYNFSGRYLAIPQFQNHESFSESNGWGSVEYLVDTVNKFVISGPDNQ
ncbi:hypothetical protein PTW35_19575 (plasmid) [Photobacterium sp. DA100]|uniref:hypothetical protein n=1 Tax=Photobacterium sp. DA100 TaxID=3027472 RepID=UPI00247B0AF7|nr:hypothetical protein [Photobacterium sp. DA100]WEM45289.1 hypothetical protein PTW35_19575 [Photobacterium sp. DA100]